MEDKKLVSRFVVLTFCIAYGVSGALVVLGRWGYQVYGWVQTPAQWAANLPFALYILSPAIASYGTLRRSGRAISFPQWLGAVFHVEKKGAPYLFVAAGLVVYFAIHGIAFGQVRLSLPLSAFFLSLPGNLIIGGMEEAGWSYLLQPALCRRWGYLRSCLLTGGIWILWHIPLFFIPGTSHEQGMISFWMFAVQCLSLRFFFGAVIQLWGESAVFLCVLFHTMFNAAFSVFGAMTTTWRGTMGANGAIVLLSAAAVAISGKRSAKMDEENSAGAG